MDITNLLNEVKGGIEAIKTEKQLAVFFREYLSKTGKITAAMSGLKDIAPDKRGEFGAELNRLKRETEKQFFALQKNMKDAEINQKLLNDKLIDITVPEFNKCNGSLHPMTYVMRSVADVCSSMGFHIEDGPEIVTEYENFDSVNMPKDHPSRDIQDTFWLSNGQLLKTQTTAMQNAILKKYKKELAGGGVLSAVFPGRCYRNEATDVSHEFAFFQCEGIMVGKNISIANLIYVMKKFLSGIFEKEIDVRLRPGYFPFTEPGFELDASCPFCGRKGCSTCKHSGWIEFAGCGMIHENVFKMADINPDKFQGFAFGFGLTRLAMLKYGVKDVRLFNSCNLEFLKEIKR
jgi:phenylalanyl-tRNA synthetase alpha chain